MMKKIFIAGFFVLFLALSCFALPSPQTEIEVMVNSVLDVMRNPDLTVVEKKLEISGRVQRFLNVESMSRRTLGPYWEEATEEQLQHFSQLFVRILEGTYLSRIENYSDGTVKYLQQRVKDDKAIIDTLIVAQDLEIPVQYKMIYVDGSWQVFDLVIEGVSLIRNYRASYGEIIRQEGYDGLFTRMEEKLQAMEQPPITVQ